MSAGSHCFGVAFLVGGEELLAHLPRLVDAEVVADHAEHLAGDVQRLVGGEEHDAPAPSCRGSSPSNSV